MKTVAKAIVAAVTAGAAAVGTAAADGEITGNEWWVVLGAVLVAGFGVWRVPNAQPAA